jgi:hypothetical protein
MEVTGSSGSRYSYTQYYYDYPHFVRNEGSERWRIFPKLTQEEWGLKLMSSSSRFALSTRIFYEDRSPLV